MNEKLLIQKVSDSDPEKDNVDKEQKCMKDKFENNKNSEKKKVKKAKKRKKIILVKYNILYNMNLF